MALCPTCTYELVVIAQLRSSFGLVPPFRSGFGQLGWGVGDGAIESVRKRNELIGALSDPRTTLIIGFARTYGNRPAKRLLIGIARTGERSAADNQAPDHVAFLPSWNAPPPLRLRRRRASSSQIASSRDFEPTSVTRASYVHLN